MTVHWHKMTDDQCNLSKYMALKQILSDVDNHYLLGSQVALITN